MAPCAGYKPCATGRLRETAPPKTGPLCYTPTINERDGIVPCPFNHQGVLANRAAPIILPSMIVTHTQNAQGQRRLYLGGKSPLECWIEPDVDGVRWTFNALDAVTEKHSGRHAAQEELGELNRMSSFASFLSFVRSETRSSRDFCAG
jgi:hypothetical protein